MSIDYRVGTAGWSIPKPSAAEFPDEGSHLQRYATRFSAVEINSSFYRSHKTSTYARWAASVPPGFRFAVKVPKEISHTRKLIDVTESLDRFLAEISALENKLGPLLVQLPPSLRYDKVVARSFFDTLRRRFAGKVVCEPRHASWFEDDVDLMLSDFKIARVAADPATVLQAAKPGGWAGLFYRRLHGSPKIYYSTYSADYLDMIKNDMSKARRGARENWCIFDNTASGEATQNALDLLTLLDRN